MTLYAPLRGLCPIPGRAGDIAELPYDVMSRAEACAMAEGRPHSFLHVSRPDIDAPEGTPAEQTHPLAAAALARLVAEGLLVRDEVERFWVYRLTDGRHSQTGVVGGASVAAYADGRIRRHETTRPDKQAERAGHIEVVGAQTGPVFLVHRPDPVVAEVVAAVTSVPATTSIVGPGGVRHELWPLTDAAAGQRLVAAFEAMAALYVADGHHRSAAAAMVHARRGTAASGRFLSVIFPSDQVRILAYNRVVRATEGVTGSEVVAALARRCTLTTAPGPVLPAHPGRVGLYADGRWFALALPPGPEPGSVTAALDVAVLQQQLLGPVLGIDDPRTDPRIGFVGGARGVSELEAAVDSGTWTAAFTLHPTSIHQLLAVADAGAIMPPKSTWFEPKLLDGLVSHVLD